MAKVLNRGKASRRRGGRRRIERPTGIGGLKLQAQSLLAAISMASLWQDKFQGGWIDLGAAVLLSLHIDKSKATGDALSEAARQAFYRARVALQALGSPEVELDESRAAIRLAQSPSAELRQWLWDNWARLVPRDLWQEFMSPASVWDIRYASAQARSRELADSGHLQPALASLKDIFALPHTVLREVWQRKAISNLTDVRKQAVLLAALEDPHPPHPLPRVLDDLAHLVLGRFDLRYARNELALARAEAYLRDRTVPSVTAADAILTTLFHEMRPVRDAMDGVFVARAWTAKARCCYLSLRLNGPLTGTAIRNCHHALDHAEAHEAGLSPLDRSHIVAVRSWIRLEDSLHIVDPDERARILWDARRLACVAFQYGHLARSLIAMREALYGLVVIDAALLLDGQQPTIDSLALIWNIRILALTHGSGLDELQFHQVLSKRGIPDGVGMPWTTISHSALAFADRLQAFRLGIWSDHLLAHPAQAQPEKRVHAAYNEYVTLVQYLIAAGQVAHGLE